MKHFGCRVGIALVTFCLGIGTSWLALLASPTLEIEPPSLIEIILVPALETPSVVLPQLATVVFKRSHKNEHGVVLAEFEVTNVSNVKLSYAGDSSRRTWIRYYFVRRGSGVREPDRTCGTGLTGYELLPGRSVTFEVVVGAEPGTVQVGFEFFVGMSYLQQTVWSDEVYVSE